MRHEVRALDVKLSIANGTAKRIDDLIRAAVFLGTTDGVAPVGASVKIQGKCTTTAGAAGSSDFAMFEWVDIATIANAAIVAGSRTDVPEGFTQIRLVTLAYTSGNLVAAVSAKNCRTDGA